MKTPPHNSALPKCRFCDARLAQIVLNLGTSPLANSFLSKDELAHPETKYPLCVRICDKCLLVQTDAEIAPEFIFSDYAYFSSYSDLWLAHAKAYTDAVVPRFNLGSMSHVIEVASNDGYLLKNFVSKGIPCLGIEPADNVAAVARAAGVPTICAFLGEDTARNIVAKSGTANLVIANNVLAHVPDINGFVSALNILLAEDGVLTIECPHLQRLIDEAQFDTIYHEHFFYFSLLAIERVFARHGLRVFDVEEIPTHGGSLRIYAEHPNRVEARPETQRLSAVRTAEKEAGIHRLDYYDDFSPRVETIIAGLRHFFHTARADGKSIVAYGAAAKGNTLLNACTATRDDIAYVVDRNPHKQGRYLPGTHIPVCRTERIAETKPDYVLILPWNLKDEIIDKMSHIRTWGGRFVVPVPELHILNS